MGSTGKSDMPLSGAEVGTGWNYQGITEAVDRLENSLNRTNSINRISSIYRALREQDTVISRELESGDGDRRVLLSQRRRVRQLMRRITSEERL